MKCNVKKYIVFALLTFKITAMEIDTDHEHMQIDHDIEQKLIEAYKQFEIAQLELDNTLMEASQQPKPALFLAIQENNKEDVLNICNQMPEMLNKTYLAESPLIYACKRGLWNLVDILIEKGCLVNAKDQKDDSTPLHFVASHGKEHLVALLLKRNADVNAKEKNGETPLCTLDAQCKTKAQKYMRIAKKLIQSGASILDGDCDNDVPFIDRFNYFPDLQNELIAQAYTYAQEHDIYRLSQLINYRSSFDANPYPVQNWLNKKNQ